MPRAVQRSGGYNIFSILNLILNAIGVGAVLWWCFASWRLHNLHTPLISEPDAPVSHTRGGKGGKKHGAEKGEVGDKFGTATFLGKAQEHAVASGNVPPPFWVFCATQWQDCWCDGDIRWGNEETWHVVPVKKMSEPQKITCTIDHLPDVLPGDDLKHCECLITPGSPSYLRTNAMMLEDDEAERVGATLVSSCELFLSARKKQPVDMAQWLAMEGLCSEEWEEKMRFNRSMKGGPKQIPLEVRQQLLRARVDVRFKKNMAQLTEHGWFRHGWVTYVAGEPTSPFVQMAGELIKSVHYFSQWPIIVFNFGMVTPEAWTPERFPRLVILHSKPLPREEKMKRSFNFNKLRSILMSRVQTGIQVDVDQFIAPGADILFKLTEKYVNKAYPFPLMPAHFLDWSSRHQKDAPWWPRYCPDPEQPCPMQTMRWAHAHPTWTYWALPFFGRWVRRHFRDERLPNVTFQGFDAAGLRVGDVMEDEDLLNVALWEERATKQWCKIDVPATIEFESLLSWKHSDGEHCRNGIGCENIGGDERWYKHGVPKVYWTAHHAVEPEKTAQFLERIRTKQKEDKWPPAIVYEAKFWPSGEELHEAHPDLKCLT